MEYKTLAIERTGSISYLFLNRPEVLNALSHEMRLELLHYLNQAKEDEGLRVLIISGKGRAFSAGGDLEMYKRRYETFRREGRSEHGLSAELPRAIINFPQPIIAAVNGVAVGFGLTMSLGCDIRIASTHAKFGFGFTRIGATPEFGGSYFLPRLLGYGKAAELIFTAKTLDAEEALQIGLVNRVVAPENLLPEVEKMAFEIAQLPAGAIRAAKQLLRHGSHSTLEQVIEYETLQLQHLMQTPEHYDALCRTIHQIRISKE